MSSSLDVPAGVRQEGYTGFLIHLPSFSPAGLSSDLYLPRSIEGKSRTKLCQKRPQVPGLGHLQSYARFKGGKTKQGYQRMVGWCRLMVMADGDG